MGIYLTSSLLNIPNARPKLKSLIKSKLKYVAQSLIFFSGVHCPGFSAPSPIRSQNIFTLFMTKVSASLRARSLKAWERMRRRNKCSCLSMQDCVL
jgi:hypothetical protein